MAMELMSPAGSMEGIIAAVRGGADAVYFGTGDYNARRNAKNLEGEELADAFRYCRLRGVKTYVTMNTLVTDRELVRAKELVLKLSELGADALIVQDLGMARLIRAVAPELPIHASTQMTLHNLGGVLAAQKLGFTRVVLSRELPLREIEFICKRSPVEIEVFVHGALCMCYSGQCYLSSAIGGRSGNRGLCAQPCRMQYSFFGGRPDYPLSLKDSSMAQHLKELEQAGVHTLKIEGRMKRPEYTALVTNIYKRALVENREPTREELEQLQQVFSRDGFTDGYLMGKKGSHMFGTRKEEAGREARALYKQAQTIYQTQPEPPTIPVELHFSARSGQDMTLAVTDRDGNRYETTGQPAEPAISRATTEEEVAASLSKTGGTVFKAEKVHIQLEEGLRASAAALNAMRRQCLEGLALVRRQPPKRKTGDWQPGLKRLPYERDPGFIYSYLTDYCFDPDSLHRKIAHLSGGEKNLLQLAVLAVGKAQVLLLDEPSSHLDTFAQEALEEAVEAYPGAVLMVSHDFYTIANCVDSVLFVENGTVRPMSGRAFRKMIYKHHFNKDYLLLEQQKKELEIRIAHCLKAGDCVKAQTLCDQLGDVVDQM